MSLAITLEFGGGAELLFDKIKKRNIELPPLQKYLTSDTISTVEKKWNLKHLLQWLKDNLLRERPELFVQGETVRPGILVLVNDSDWELLGELDYELKPNDCVLFISTLHGG